MEETAYFVSSPLAHPSMPCVLKSMEAKAALDGGRPSPVPIPALCRASGQVGRCIDKMVDKLLLQVSVRPLHEAKLEQLRSGIYIRQIEVQP